MLNGQTITLNKEVQYNILKSLKKGKQVDIWEVKQLDNQQHYALKIINRYQFGRIENTALLINYTQAEIDFLSSLNTPEQHHIAPCLDAGTVTQIGQHLPCMIMPLALYQQDNLATLSNKMRSPKSAITAQQWLTWFRQLIAALQYLQQLSTKQKPLTHRNIQPQNCLLDKQQDLFLTDFALVQANSHTRHNALLDNVDYCAPEQVLTRSKIITQAVDIYAVAVIMYELIAGKMLAQAALNNPTEDDKLGNIGGLTEQEETSLQAQLMHLFTGANNSRETITNASKQLTHLLQTMLAPLPQERPRIATIVKKLDRVIANLYPNLKPVKTKIDVPPTKKTTSSPKPRVKLKTKKKTQQTQPQPVDYTPQPASVKAQPSQPIVTPHKKNDRDTYYFSGTWHIESSMEMNIIGNEGSVLVIHNDAAVIGDIKCHRIQLETYANVRGTITAQTIELDGEVVGDVYAHTLIVGVMSKTAVEGNVHSFKLLSNGTIDGEIYALESLELFEQSRTKGGDVYFKQLNMEVGAEVNGRLINYTETDNVSLPISEQTLQQRLKLDKVHTGNTATHHFVTDEVFDSSAETHAIHFVGNDTAKLTIKKGNSIVGNISCYSLHIEQGATVTGTIKCHRLNNEGNIVGDIYAHSIWFGSPKQTNSSAIASSKGQVKCHQLNLNGSIDGDVHVVDRSVLLEQAEITGELYYNHLDRKTGAQVGKLLIIDGTEQHHTLQQELEAIIPKGNDNNTNDTENNNEGNGCVLPITLFVIAIVFIILFIFV